MAKYEAGQCPDDINELSALLRQLSEEGDEVVTVLWQPARCADPHLDHAGSARDLPSGYTVIWKSRD